METDSHAGIYRGWIPCRPGIGELRLAILIAPKDAFCVLHGFAVIRGAGQRPLKMAPPLYEPSDDEDPPSLAPGRRPLHALFVDHDSSADSYGVMSRVPGHSGQFNPK